MRQHLRQSIVKTGECLTMKVLSSRSLELFQILFNDARFNGSTEDPHGEHRLLFFLLLSVACSYEARSPRRTADALRAKKKAHLRASSRASR